MKNIAIIIGIKTDSISEERFPEWLKDIPQSLMNKSKENWGDGIYGLASDVGIAYYIQKFSTDNVSILTKKDISLKKFNEFDVIVGLYDPYYYTNETYNSKSYQIYNQIIKKTKATFIQPLSLQKFVLNKKLYMETLKKHNIPVVPTISFTIKDNMNIPTIIQKIDKQCSEWGSPIFISKPQPGGFGTGFKKWDILKVLKNKSSFKRYIHKIEKEVRIEKPLLLIQKFVPEFELFYEVRTYWMNGKYSHSIGTIIDPLSLGGSGFEEVKFAYPENEYDDEEFETYDDVPEVIEQKLVNKLKRIGKKVIDILPTDSTGKPFLLRIDFGCCVDNQNVCRDYFVNEIEYVPNLFPEYSTHIDVMGIVGESIIRKIKML
jgi:hypothetical protein